MSYRTALHRLGVALLLVLLLQTSNLDACNVPVFRYALERWKPESYEVLLFHRGPLAQNDRVVADALAKYVEGGDKISNLTFSVVNLADNPSDEALEIFETQNQPPLPWLVVRNPSGRTVWAGRLQPWAIAALLDSPVRRELAKRILAGASAVWLLLESGNKTQDDAAFALLNTELRQLEKTLKLKDMPGDPDDKPLIKDGPPLRIAFSILRVSRTDPKEQVLVGMLLHSEKDLLERKEPMVFPVFARGHCMLPMMGKGIHPDNIESAAAAIVSYCEDTFRRTQQYVDLLVTADWEALIQGRRVREPGLPSLAGLGDVVGPNARSSGGEADLPIVEFRGSWSDPWYVHLWESPLQRNLILAVIGGLLVLAVATRVLMKRGQR